jgi:hypothetical protein
VCELTTSLSRPDYKLNYKRLLEMTLLQKHHYNLVIH